MENPRLFSQYPRMVADIMNEMFTIDGTKPAGTQNDHGTREENWADQLAERWH